MYNNKEVKVLLSEEADSIYTELNSLAEKEKSKGDTSSFHQTLLRSINRAKELLKQNPFLGNQVPKKLIPPKYILKYGAENVWRVELSDRWRLVYAITGNQIEVITFIMEIFNHRDYDKVFGYKH